MAHAAYNLMVEPTNAYWGNGADKILHKAYLITGDAPAVVEAANYLNASASRLPKGTIIKASMTAGGTPVGKDYIVTSNNGTTVVIAVFTAAAG